MTNGEKYKTAKERHTAFCKWCDDHINGCNDCKLKGDAAKTYMCSFAWLDLEAPAEEPLPCPFCGGVCCIESDRIREFWVECEKCRYSSSIEETKEEAISAHNCVARAVAKEKEANDANA